MKKNNLLFVSLIAVISMFIMTVAGCKTKEDIKDCEANNYGVVHINFASAATRHGLIVTQSGTTNFRAKLLEIGTTTDTLHLAPATWLIDIASIDNLGSAIDQTTKTAITAKCSDETFTVTF